MKKLGLMLLLLAMFTISASAQSGTGYFGFLPGYQFSSDNVDSGYVLSMNGGYFFDENWGARMGLNRYEGKYSLDDHDLGFLIPYLGEDWNHYSDSYYIFEIGPELAGTVGKGQLYWQIVNLGYTFGAENNDWTWGTAAGYRYPLNDRVGLNFQATYHRVNDIGPDFDDTYLAYYGLDEWDAGSADLWDLRFGVVWKF